jgi:hypothetical protein
MPLYYGERSWNSLNLRSFFQSVDAGGVTPTTYATSRLDLSNGVMTEREENSPLTSVISVQRNTNAKRHRTRICRAKLALTATPKINVGFGETQYP